MFARCTKRLSRYWRWNPSIKNFKLVRAANEIWLYRNIAFKLIKIILADLQRIGDSLLVLDDEKQNIFSAKVIYDTKRMILITYSCAHTSSFSSVSVPSDTTLIERIPYSGTALLNILAFLKKKKLFEI